MTVTSLPRPASALLPALTEPADLRSIPRARLERLAAEIRADLVERVCATGGHLGSNLGMVELTIALHRVFKSPRDTIVFDGGHQAYVHKMLTGRREDFARLRRPGGLSGYPSRTESVHDVMENSHASTALAYADGLAKAYQLRRRPDRSVVAVIGDGALTGGLAWEGLNNLGGAPGRPVIVVLNDNDRSYAPTVGGLGEHLRKLRRARPRRGRCGGETVDGSLFTQLGFAYLGPVDGHDVVACEQALRRARAIGRPVVVHCVTAKGHGYPPAEQDEADHMHGVGVMDPVTGKPFGPAGRSWTSVFADELCAIGADRSDVVAITAAMAGPTGLAAFAERFPDRSYDVGIAEQQAACSAAGLALGGLHPVVAVYASFLNRAFDQVVMDVALHGLPVTFVLDRAGITGPDGSTHHGTWDLSILGVVPGVRVAAPRDATRLRELLREAVDDADGPTVLRFPKATAELDIDTVDRVGGVDILYRSRCGPPEVLIVAVGALADPCIEAARTLERHGIGVTVADPRWVIPTNPALTALADGHRLVVTAEDSSRAGGVGSLLAQACADAGVRTPVRNLGIPRAFVAHGNRRDLLDDAGLSSGRITLAVLAAHAAGTERRPR